MGVTGRLHSCMVKHMACSARPEGRIGSPSYIVLSLAAVLLIWGVTCARGIESLQLLTKLPELENSGNWRNTLEQLTAYGVPQNWTILGPLSADSVRLFDRQLDPEKTDDWSKPMTDNMGRVFKASTWEKPKDDDGCFVDLNDLFTTPPPAPLVFAGAEIQSPVDGPGLLWFENSGRAVVYWNNQIVLGGSAPNSPGNQAGVTGRKSRYEGQYNSLYPVPIELKQGKNVLKVKLLKDRSGGLKGWGFFARLERNDLEWHRLLLAKLKELYPAEDAGETGAGLRVNLARQLEQAGKIEEAQKLYGEVAKLNLKCRDASDDALDALKRFVAGQPGGDVVRAWSAASSAFKTALEAGRAIEADRAMRLFLAQFPFAEEAGLALCYRGGLRLDYAADEAARPFFERAIQEFSRVEAVRKAAVKGIEFARFFKPQHSQFDTQPAVEATLAAITRQVQNGNKIDCAAGLKSLSELLLSRTGALVRAGGDEHYPRYAGIGLVAREFIATFSDEERKMFREPLERGAQSKFQQASNARDPAALEDVALRFPGTAAAAQALNQAGNIFLDRAEFERAAQVFHTLRRDYEASGLVDVPMVAAKEIRALAALNQVDAAREEAKQTVEKFAAARVVVRGEQVAVNELVGKLAGGTPADPDAGKMPAVPEAGRMPALPGGVEWTRQIKQTDFLNRARGSWSEDRWFYHYEAFPIVSNGKVFSTTRDEIRAIDLESGKELWTKNWSGPNSMIADKFSGYPLSMPCASDGRVYMRAFTPERQSVLRCYAEADGTLLWDTQKITALRGCYMSSEPLAAYNFVYAVYCEPLDADTSRCGMVALDAKTGALAWKRVFGVGASGIQISERVRESRLTPILYRVTLQLGPPSAQDGMIYTSTGLASLAALNAFSGEIDWIAAYPSLRTGNIATGHSGIEYFIPRLMKFLARGPSSPVLSGDIVALAPRDAAGVLAFERGSGELLWANELMDARYIAGICNGNLLAADDTVTAINMKTGRAAWEYSPDGKRLLAQPGYSGGILYLPYEDGIHRVDARTGKSLETTKWDPKLTNGAGNLRVSGRHIIGATYNSVFSLGAK